MSHVYEVEIKSLLGSKENASGLISRLQEKFPQTKLENKEKQLNHYFVAPADLSLLKKEISVFLTQEQITSLDLIIKEGKKVSIRTRDTNGKVLFVIKASVGDDTSANGVKRIEFEAVIQRTLAELDGILLAAGCAYQAKWSREREVYQAGDINVCLDKNAGYGYVAEFEKITTVEADLEKVRTELLSTMESLGAKELPQDRLERMFAHYNTHWPEYYGTEKTFIIE